MDSEAIKGKVPKIILYNFLFVFSSESEFSTFHIGSEILDFFADHLYVKIKCKFVCYFLQIVIDFSQISLNLLQ